TRRSSTGDVDRYTPSMIVRYSSAGGSATRIQPRPGSTGPPIQSGRSLPRSTSGSSRTIVLAAISVGRFSTSPNAPSAPKSDSSTTVRVKFGSCSWGIETRNVGRNGSDMIGGLLQVCHESTHLFMSGPLVRGAKDGRGVDRRQHVRRERRVDELAAPLG